jgi:hypothetical protein
MKDYKIKQYNTEGTYTAQKREQKCASKFGNKACLKAEPSVLMS